MKKVEVNRSKTYLLPLICEYVDIKPPYFKYLQNTYLYDSEGKYSNCFFIEHYIDFRSPDLTKYEHDLIDNQLYIKSYDLNKNKTVHVFKFPEEYIKEYNHYEKGEYSQFGVDAKELILNFYTHILNGNIKQSEILLKLKQILYKEDILRRKLEKELSVLGGPKIVLEESAELGEIMDKDNETINLNN